MLGFMDLQYKRGQTDDATFQGTNALQTRMLLCAKITFHGRQNQSARKCAKVFHNLH